MRIPDARRQRLRTAGPWVIDGLLAVAAAGVGVAALVTVLPFDPGSPRAWAAYLLVAAHTLPIAVRRRWPVAVLGWGLATGVAFAALGLNLVPLSFAVLIYVYTVAAHRPRRISLAGLAATEAVLGLVWLARPQAIGDGGTLMLDGLIMAAGWWLGDGARRRQEAAVTAQQRAAELEQAREELARRAVSESASGRQSTDPDRQIRRSGLGIAGMRERAALYGGTLEAGSLPGGGFRVAASLPVEDLS
jgi:hypothetical protein